MATQTLGYQARFETIRSFDSSTFSGSYQALGTPLANPSVLLYIYNASGVLVTLSDDGTNDKFVIAATTGLIIDFGSDSQSISGDKRLSVPQNTQFYIKGSASTGLVYLSTVYQGG